MDTNQLQFQTEIFLEYNIQEHKVKDDIYQTQNLEYWKANGRPQF